jgi:uncharacterized cupredoxin-like copper-binding protein
MEESHPLAEGAKGASGGKMWMVATIIVAILLIASLTVFVVLPALNPPPSTTKVFKFDLVAQDFAYDRIGFNPSFTVNVNTPIWFVFSNNGTNVHEFLLYRINQTTTRASVLADAYQDLAQAQAAHPNWASDPVEANLTLDDYNTLHDGDARLTRYNDIDRNVDPDATTDLVFVLHEAGNYFFVCHQVDTSVNPWKIHQDHGMWGLLTVNA